MSRRFGAALPPFPEDPHQPPGLVDLVGHFRQGLPSSLFEQFDGLYVGFYPGEEPQAFAYAPDPSSRWVAASGGLEEPLLAVALLHEAAIPLLLREAGRVYGGSRGSTDLPGLLELWQDLGQRAFEEFMTAPIVRDATRSIQLWRNRQPTLAAAELFRHFPRRGSPTPPQHAMALGFILSHEIAHHLLGHTRREGFDDEALPATELLRAWKWERGRRSPWALVPTDGLTDRQRQELDADLFALVGGSGAWTVRSDETAPSWVAALVGGMVALHCLDLIAVTGGDMHSPTGTAGETREAQGATHPPLGLRTTQLVAAAHHSGPASHAPFQHPLDFGLMYLASSGMISAALD